VLLRRLDFIPISWCFSLLVTHSNELGFRILFDSFLGIGISQLL